MSNLKQEKRQRFLSNLIKEAILNVLVEQDEMMQQTAPPVPPPEATAPAPEAPVEQQPQQPVFTVDTMVEKLNTLRGAQSFKDPEVYGRLTTFFRNLTDEQKSSIEWLLEELTKIVVDVGPTPQSTAPQQPAPEATPAPQTAPEPTNATPAPMAAPIQPR